MKREIEKLASREWDVLIVGGGIYGAWALWDATLRGLSAALIEKDDFGGATSSNSLKIIHGGLRYLQHLDIKRMRESIHERKVLMRVAPQFVHPLPCVMPTYGHGVKGKEVMTAAMIMNDIIGFDRNKGSDPQKILPNGKTISKEELLEILPGLDETNLTGGAVWYDCQVYNSERMLISVIKSAVKQGAMAANHTEVLNFITEGNKVLGLNIRDKISGMTYTVKSKIVLNTTGPWINNLLGQLNGHRPKEEFRLSKAMNLVVNKRITQKFAAGIPSKFEFKDADAVINKGSRLLFFTPWREYTLIGTTHVPWSGNPDEFAITEEDVTTFLDEFNQAYPAMAIQRDEVVYHYGGLLPMDDNGEIKSEHDVKLTKHYKLIDHQQLNGLEGLVSILGVKYTTARDVAAKSVNVIMKKLRKRGRSRTEKVNITGGEIGNFAHFMQEERAKRPWSLDESVVEHLVYNFGADYTQVLALLNDNDAWSEKVSDDAAVLQAEIVYGIREEMALHLTDVIKRRTELGSAAYPGDEAAERCADLMAAELGWDDEQKEYELDALKQSYQTVD
ncbi:glycerol-3-phosphate dehydrogenase/oxidase [candidate division KSB1 bacterium]|nr:glycerol-3-phosphate dehydrogenase/oxidase [candidate division KSB1 bacterium]